jgi:LAO/AO transport system kinase
MMDKRKRPEWVPIDAGFEFTSNLMDPAAGGHDGLSGESRRKTGPGPKRRKLRVQDYVQGVLGGDRTILARAITLVESNAAPHVADAQEMLKAIIPHSGKSIRVGVTGFPGAGKSTFIEALGNDLCDQGHRLAVLAVDPSSSVTRGSILGDKTRMERLAQRKEAFIRPSPSGGVLGGVARKTRETMLVLEAAGHDVIIVETVGVGQNETTVRDLVDFFLLLVIAGAGDELQGIKRGIMELTDAILVNKADGDNMVRAEAAKAEINQVLPYLQPITEGWETEAYTCSSLNGTGISEIWSVIERFKKHVSATGFFERRRRDQAMHWVKAMVDEYLATSFWDNERVKAVMNHVKHAVVAGEISPTLAAETLVQAFEGKK